VGRLFFVRFMVLMPLDSLSKEVFNTDRGLWLATNQNELYPNPLAFATESEHRVTRWAQRLLSVRTAHQLSWYGFVSSCQALRMGGLADFYRRSDGFWAKPCTKGFWWMCPLPASFVRREIKHRSAS